MAATKATPTETAREEIDKAVWKPPIDPGDAGGVGAGDERKFAPGTLHKRVEDVPALEEAARLAGRP